MRVLVTGVAGFIGARLAAELLARGFNVVGIDALTDYYSVLVKKSRLRKLDGHARFQFHPLDLSRDPLSQCLTGVESVFHCAGQPGVRASWSTGFDEHVRNNLVATHRLLEAIVDRSVSKFVYSSSSSVYGNQVHFPTVEAAPKAPFSPYGVSKLAAENLCFVYAANYGVPVVSLRYFTVFGGGQRPDMAIQRMIEASLTGAPFPIYGDGRQERDFTHVTDVIEANFAALESPSDSGEVYNIAGGSTATVAQLLEIVSSATGRPVPVAVQGSQMGDVQRTEASTDAAQSVLGWRPQVSLDDGVREQVDWALQDRVG